MTLLLALSPEEEATLQKQAAERGQETSEYARRLLMEQVEQIAIALKPRPFHETATPEEWVAAWHEWTQSHDPNGPVLLDDSREVIYANPSHNN